MNKLEITKKVNETNYYSNSGDADRAHDVSAKVTIGEGAPIISEGVVTIKGGDAIVASFTKAQYDSLRISFAGVEVPAVETINAIMADVCAFLTEINNL